jgi:3,4-dihydroxy 2-butanone 4-phosphate synthase/GTP cyclohydrolase II
LKEEATLDCPRSKQAPTVERVSVARLPTEVGEFRIAGYRSRTSDEEFVALYKGELNPETRLIEEEGRGAVVYQLQEGRGIGIINKIRAYALQDEGADTVEANERLGLAVDLREYRQCAEVLFDLGLCRVRLMSNNPLKLRAMEEAGLRVVERVALEVEPADAAMHYLRTKKAKLGHLLDHIE